MLCDGKKLLTREKNANPSPGQNDAVLIASLTLPVEIIYGGTRQPKWEYLVKNHFIEDN